MNFARRVFFTAAVYGFVSIVPGFFTEARTSHDFPPEITHPEYYYGFYGVGLAWQVLFLILSKDPVRFRPMMIPAVLEKASFSLAVLVLLALGRVPPFLLVFAAIDAIFGILFLIAYSKTRTV